MNVNKESLSITMKQFLTECDSPMGGSRVKKFINTIREILNERKDAETGNPSILESDSFTSRSLGSIDN